MDINNDSLMKTNTNMMSFGPSMQVQPRTFRNFGKKNEDDSMELTREKGNSLDFRVTMRNDEDLDAVDIGNIGLNKNQEVQQSFGVLDSPNNLA